MSIRGNTHTDSRGTVVFFNDFDLSPIVRMYRIEADLGMIRAWQGHKKETKWFYVARGKFRVKLRKLETLKMLSVTELDSNNPVILEIKPGHYNGFQALKEDSILMVFSDLTLEDSKLDDYRLSIKEVPWEGQH